MQVPDYCELESCKKPVILQSKDHVIVTHEITRKGISLGEIEKNFHAQCANKYLTDCAQELKTKGAFLNENHNV